MRWKPLESFDLQTAYAACAATTRKAGTSFYWAMSLLPEPQRSEMFALYAFCRRADDIADEPMPEEQREPQFRQLEAELAAIYSQRQCADLEMAALGQTIWRRRIPRNYLTAIIDGCRQDSSVQVYTHYAELERYCHQVSTAVGLATTHICGLRGEDLLEYATCGGVAVQLTNILRDVDEDRSRGRIYLPAAWLQAEGVTSQQILAGEDSPGLRRVARRLALRAEALYARAQRVLRLRERRALTVLELVQVLYRPLLHRLLDRDCAVFAERLRLPSKAKLSRALGYYAERLLPPLGHVWNPHRPAKASS